MALLLLFAKNNDKNLRPKLRCKVRPRSCPACSRSFAQFQKRGLKNRNRTSLCGYSYEYLYPTLVNLLIVAHLIELIMLNYALLPHYFPLLDQTQICFWENLFIYLCNNKYLREEFEQGTGVFVNRRFRIKKFEALPGSPAKSRKADARTSRVTSCRITSAGGSGKWKYCRLI